MALGSITEGPPKLQFSEVIVGTAPILLDLFKDQSVKVREANSWVLSRICENHADVLLEPNTLKSFMYHILVALKDLPKISYHCCTALEKLAVACEPTAQAQQQNPLSQYYQEILQHLEANGERQDFQGSGVDLTLTSYVTMTTIVQNSCDATNELTYQLLIPTLQKLERTLEADLSPERAAYLQDLLCGLVQVMLIKIGDKAQKPLVTNIVMVIIRLFKQAGKVTENGLIALQGAVVGCGEHIEIPEVGQYIKHALESKETDCTKLACGIISDLSGAHQGKMSEFLDDFVPCLHDILRDQTIQKEMKIPALHAMGDLAVYCAARFCQSYLTWTL